MGKFLRYILTVSIITVLLAYLLDAAYTYVFHHSLGRQKVDVIYNSPPLSYDVIFLGSSRANNHIMPEFFEEQGIHAVNFGMSGAYLPESALMLKLFLEKGHRTKCVVLEADIAFTQEGMSEVISSMFLPYLHSSPAVNDHFSDHKDYQAMKYVPFYRYAINEPKIGFREMYLAAAGKSTRHMDNGGYTALDNEDVDFRLDLSPSEIIPNKYYDQIKKLCSDHNIQLFVITTPVCDRQNTEAFFDCLKITYPEIHRFEYTLLDNKYFASCGHLNDKGARAFTGKLLEFYHNIAIPSAKVPDAD